MSPRTLANICFAASVTVAIVVIAEPWPAPNWVFYMAAVLIVVLFVAGLLIDTWSDR